MEAREGTSVENQLRRLNALYSEDEISVGEPASSPWSSSSALTDSFRERISSAGSVQLLGNFLQVLENWTKEKTAVTAEEEHDENLRKKHEKKERKMKGALSETSRESEEDQKKTEDTEPVQTEEIEDEIEDTTIENVKMYGRNIEKIDETEATGDLEAMLQLREAKRLFAYRLVDTDAPTLTEELGYYCQEGDGNIMVEHIPFVLRSFGCNPTEEEGQKIMKNIKNDYGDKIDSLNFLHILLEQQYKTYSTKDILSVFAAMDVTGEGKLRKRILKKILTKRGDRLNAEEWSIFLKEGDPNGTGYINYTDFVRKMDRNLYIAVPEKRRQLMKLLKKEDKKGQSMSSDDTIPFLLNQ